jgi:uncharacterized protein YlxW (UPF0749 family)
MPHAVVQAIWLATFAFAANCWAQGAAPAKAAQLSPTIQADLLRAQVVRLEVANSRLEDRVRELTARMEALTKGVSQREQLAATERQINALVAENAALRKELGDVQESLARSEGNVSVLTEQLRVAGAVERPDVERLRTELSSTRAGLRQEQQKVATLEASEADARNSLAASYAIIQDLQRDLPRRQARTPLWPWGAIAAAAALVLGATLARMLWPKVVGRPLSVSVKLAQWVPKAASKNLALAPSFGVRSELVPRASRVRAAREPLVREVRVLQQGVAG